MAHDDQVNELSAETFTAALSQRDGRPVTTSREVARLFGKNHQHVLRDIDALISAEPELEGPSNFGQTPYVEPSNGQTYRQYEMTRDGFVLLAMGFTGAKALKFKIGYIAAFNAMEERIRQQASDPIRALNDPAAMRGLLLTYSEKVLTLQAINEELAPKAIALDRLSTAEGSMCITDAAKTLQVQPKALFQFLRSHRWVYTRAGCNETIAYQDKLVSALLEHKTTTVTRSDGSEKVTTQVRVTPKGLTRLAKELQPVARAA